MLQDYVIIQVLFFFRSVATSFTRISTGYNTWLQELKELFFPTALVQVLFSIVTFDVDVEENYVGERKFTTVAVNWNTSCGLTTVMVHHMDAVSVTTEENQCTNIASVPCETFYWIWTHGEIINNFVVPLCVLQLGGLVWGWL